MNKLIYALITSAAVICATHHASAMNDPGDGYTDPKQLAAHEQFGQQRQQYGRSTVYSITPSSSFSEVPSNDTSSDEAIAQELARQFAQQDQQRRGRRHHDSRHNSRHERKRGENPHRASHAQGQGRGQQSRFGQQQHFQPQQVVQKCDILKLDIEAFPWDQLYGDPTNPKFNILNPLYGTQGQVEEFFTCNPITIPVNVRGFIDGFCAQFKGSKKHATTINYDRLDKDERINALLILTGRRDLSRTGAEIFFDAITFNEMQNRFLTLQNLNDLGYVYAMNNFIHDTKKSRHPLRWISLQQTGKDTGWKG